MVFQKFNLNETSDDFYSVLPPAPNPIVTGFENFATDYSQFAQTNVLKDMTKIKKFVEKYEKPSTNPGKKLIKQTISDEKVRMLQKMGEEMKDIEDNFSSQMTPTSKEDTKFNNQLKAANLQLQNEVSKAVSAEKAKPREAPEEQVPKEETAYKVSMEFVKLTENTSNAMSNFISTSFMLYFNGFQELFKMVPFGKVLALLVAAISYIATTLATISLLMVSTDGTIVGAVISNVVFVLKIILQWMTYYSAILGWNALKTMIGMLGTFIDHMSGRFFSKGYSFIKEAFKLIVKDFIGQWVFELYDRLMAIIEMLENGIANITKTVYETAIKTMDYASTWTEDARTYTIPSIIHEWTTWGKGIPYEGYDPETGYLHAPKVTADIPVFDIEMQRGTAVPDIEDDIAKDTRKLMKEIRVQDEIAKESEEKEEAPGGEGPGEEAVEGVSNVQKTGKGAFSSLKATAKSPLLVERDAAPFVGSLGGEEEAEVIAQEPVGAPALDEGSEEPAVEKATSLKTVVKNVLNEDVEVPLAKGTRTSVSNVYKAALSTANNLFDADAKPYIPVPKANKFVDYGKIAAQQSGKMVSSVASAVGVEEDESVLEVGKKALKTAKKVAGEVVEEGEGLLEQGGELLKKGQKAAAELIGDGDEAGLLEKAYSLANSMFKYGGKLAGLFGQED